MEELKLMKHQVQALENTKTRKRVAYYHEMGLGKTFTGAEKMHRIGNRLNIVICQKSKITDWVEHFEKYYDYEVFNLRKTKPRRLFFEAAKDNTRKIVGIINYESAYRIPEMNSLYTFTMMLDESSMIQNAKSKRTKYMLQLNQRADACILLSGTPVGGKYENLISQLNLLGWNVKYRDYWDLFIRFKEVDFRKTGRPVRMVIGYKNVDLLKQKLREYGADFLKSEECLSLPQKNHRFYKCEPTKEYEKFHKDSIIKLKDGTELVGDCTLTQMLNERLLAGCYNPSKAERLKELIDSTDDRLVIFYNFNKELEVIKQAAEGRPLSIVNGAMDDQSKFKNNDNGIIAVQYQAGAMGLNLQQSNKIIYFSLPLGSELFEQSKKRIHRIGQKRPCFYFYLITDHTVEKSIYKTLQKRRDYTEALFKKENL